ncbi:MAG: 3-phosphoshikimate 1-carboxyvinyltransferase [Candidatus Marinimicrobia bacterium]|nr:3-phosphoshikimate 1-carboxyvinyltransferase [Candidatus Neomarinimicrobiota bacterium]
MHIHGSLTFAGDKSISHRALMLAALSDGECVVHNAAGGQDLETTRRCLAACGIELVWEGNSIRITGGTLVKPRGDLDCGNSGTTARLLLGLLAGQEITARFTGDESLSTRPMNRVIAPLTRMGAEIESAQGHLPLTLHSRQLTGITNQSPVASAQVKSAILLAGLGARGTTTVIEKLPTRDHTEKMLVAIGAEIESTESQVTVKKLTGNLQTFEMIVPGDPSTAAFFAVAAAGLPGSELILRQVSLNPRRIDLYSVLERMGASVVYQQTDQILGEPMGDIEIKSRPLHGVTLTAKDIPGMIDELPALAVLATQAKGITEIRGAEELRVKESDRITALCENLMRLGAKVKEHPDGMTITGPTRLKDGSVPSFGDHRIAMAFKIAGLFATGTVSIDDSKCIRISAPEFDDLLNQVLKKSTR